MTEFLYFGVTWVMYTFIFLPKTSVYTGDHQQESQPHLQSTNTQHANQQTKFNPTLPLHPRTRTIMPSVSDTTLEQSHSLVKFSIHSSTQISRRTSAVLSNLQGPPPQTTGGGETETNHKPIIIVALTAKPHATNKLISIVEIAKRDLASKNLRCFQYCALSSEMVDVARKKAKANAGGGEEGSESDEAFETMGERELGETKKRNVPVMTIYLSTRSVRELKVALG